MTYIVERLRKQIAPTPTMQEAADEIERLRALLLRHQVAAWCEEDSDLAVEPRRALEPKP